MKSWLKGIARLIACVVGVQQGMAYVYVEDLAVSRRDGTDMVDITFRLRTHDPVTYPEANVVVSVSAGGTPIAVSAVTGDVGSNVSVGTGKAIVWNAGADGGLPEGSLSITLRATSRAPWNGDPHADSWQVVSEDWVRNTYYTSGVDYHYTMSNRERGIWVDHLDTINPEYLFDGHEASDEFANWNWSGYANPDYDWRLPTPQQLMDMEPYAHLFVGTGSYALRQLQIWTYSLSFGTYEYMLGYDWHRSSEWPFDIVEEDDENFDNFRAALWPVYPSGQPWDTPLPTWDHEDTETIEIEATASDFEYEIAPGGGATIISYTGDGGAVILDATLGGVPVVAIGADAFANVAEMESLMIPPSVAHLADGSFAGSGIGRLLFRGDAPSVGQGVFEGSSLVIYRRFGTLGWGDTLGGRPVELWRAALGTGGGGVGMGAGGFRFLFNGPPEDLAVIEYRDGFGSAWTEVQALDLSFGDHEYVDPDPSPTGMRIYRVLLRYP